MIRDLFSYYYHKFSGTEFLDFVDQGLGIKARYARSIKEWQPHLECSRNFIINSISGNEHIKHLSNKTISVLGAGRLLDFPGIFISENFDFINLIDADPSCLRAWKKYQKISKAAVNWKIEDISGRLKIWSIAVAKQIDLIKGSSTEKFESSLSSFLESLLFSEEAAPLISTFPRSNLIISLNLLSQLGIYWRDRVLALIHKHNPSAFIAIQNSSRPSLIEAVLQRMSEYLESAHLKMLESSGAEMLILLYDDEFYYYSKEISNWQTEKALSLKEVPKFAGYEKISSSSWLWHIVPQGKEQHSYGEIHRVQAKVFVLKNS